MKAGIGFSISGSLVFVLALVGTGCSQDRSLAGMWQGDFDWKMIQAQTEAASRAFAAVNLELKPSGAFVLQDGGVPFTGYWTQSSSSVTLNVETYMNRPIDQQSDDIHKLSHFTIRVENNRMFFKNSVYEAEIELKKQAKR